MGSAITFNSVSPGGSFLNPDSNLSDVASASTSRDNLGLGATDDVVFGSVNSSDGSQASLADATAVTVATAGASEDGIWVVFFIATSGTCEGVCAFSSTASGVTRGDYELSAQNLTAAWSGNNMQITNTSGGNVDVQWSVIKVKPS